MPPLDPSVEQLQRALAHFHAAQFSQAAALCRQLLTRQPDHVHAAQVLGLALIQLGQPGEALSIFDQTLIVVPHDVPLNFNRGLVLLQMGRDAEAAAALEATRRLQPAHLKAHLMLATALRNQDRRDEALAVLETAATHWPAEVAVHLDRGALLYAAKRYVEAVTCFEQARLLAPNNADGWINLGCALIQLARYPEARDTLSHAVMLAPVAADAHFNLGIALAKCGHKMQAIDSYARALQLAPTLTDGWLNRGLAQLALQNHDAAIADFRQALLLRPGDVNTQGHLANALADAGYLEEALRAYEAVLAQAPRHDYMLDGWLRTRMKCCRWDGLEQRWLQLPHSIASGVKALPSSLITLSNSAALQRQCAEAYAHDNQLLQPLVPVPCKAHGHAKLRIGYFSSDFFAHATAFLMAGVFERHDRTRFETIAFSWGSPAQDAMHQRLHKAFDEFIDVSDRTDQDIVTLARGREIDIAVDLKGLTHHGRPGLFAMRLAPLQIGYLGYPCTMGSPAFDYLVGDPTLIPESSRPHFTEKILYLPHSYQANDNTRAISPVPTTRADWGLPEQAVVFCSFNNPYKITPVVFDIWMRLLRQVEGSVLWLFSTNPVVEQNLRREAQARGVDPARLVVASHQEASRHLERHHAADLFLDTFPCCAHTTASDALWAGLPLLTCAGETLASRVSASLLRAVGLPEMVTDSLQAYEARALELARRPHELRVLRDRLRANRLRAPLFDTPGFTAQLEAGYEAAYDRLRQGQAPDHIFIGSGGSGPGAASGTSTTC